MGANMNETKWIMLIIFGICFVGAVKEFYTFEKKDYSTGDTVKIEQNRIENKENVSGDSIHVSKSVIYYLENGGTIDTSTENGFNILIEIKDKVSSNEWYRLRYYFETEDEFLDAVSYIKKKGYRYILNHQYELESKNRKPKIKFEGEGADLKRYLNLTLTSMRKN